MSVNKDHSIKPQEITITLSREDFHTIISALDGEQSEAACYIAEIEDIERGPDEDGNVPVRSRYNWEWSKKSFWQHQHDKYKAVKCKLLPYLQWRNKGTGRARKPLHQFQSTAQPVNKPAE